jgi:hypothetical protein
MASTIQQRIDAAKKFLDSLYETDGTYGYIKEYPGFPLAIYVKSTSDLRLAGDLRFSNYTTWSGKVCVSNISNLVANPGNDSATIGFDEGKSSPDYKQPILLLKRIYTAPNKIVYGIQFQSYSGSKSVDVYFDRNTVWSNVGPSNIPTGSAWNFTYTGQAARACRYTIRHGGAFARWLYTIWSDSTKYIALNNIWRDFGFTCDIYDPLFGQSAQLADDYMFTHDAYHDSRDLWRQLPRGTNPLRVPYLSKLQIGGFVTLDVYINNSTGDPLLGCLQAIHLLNKYNNPAYMPTSGGLGGVSLLAYAHRLWTVSWNGYGIPSPIASSSYASAVRTACYFALCTIIGYKYGDSTCKTYADTMYNIITGTNAPQAGMSPMNTGYVYTQENGLLLRPQYQGGYYCVWGAAGSQYKAITAASVIGSPARFLATRKPPLQ